MRRFVISVICALSSGALLMAAAAQADFPYAGAGKNKHDFTLPVVDCSAMGSCNTSPPLQSFATIHFNFPTDIDPPGSGNTQCNQFPWGCSQTINNTDATGMTASQICKANRPGKPGGTGCTAWRALR